MIVVGAGVMGASTAFHLCRRKAGRVLVIDQGAVGQGMSARSSALIRMHYSFPAEVRLAVKSLEIFRNWSEYVGGEGSFRRTGFVRIVPPAEADRLRRNVEMQKALGVDARVVDGRELGEIEPDWHTDDVVAAAYEPESGYGDGAQVANGFLAAARTAGAEYRPYTRIQAFAVEAGRVRGVVTAEGHIEAPIVVAALGPWTRPLLQGAGLDLPIETEFHQVAFYKPPRWSKWPTAACIDSITKVYTRSEVGEYLLVGDFYGKRGADPDAFPETAFSEALTELGARASQRIPLLEDAVAGRGVTGVYDMSPDARPLIGETAIAGLHVAAGFSGMGFKISPAVGLALTEQILDGTSRTVDLTPFRPSRFAEGCPIKADHEYEDD